MSGVASCEPVVSVVVEEGANQTRIATAVDVAGNLATEAIGPINIDKTAPVIGCAEPDVAWHGTNVSVACTSGDTLSGLSSVADSTFMLTTSVPVGGETADAITDSRVVCDNAGNCTTAEPIGGNKVDLKTPAIGLEAPAAVTYLLHQVVPASYSCADGGSGVEACAGPVPSGAPVASGAVGDYSFAVNAQDAVGNAATRSVEYWVAFNICPLYDQTKAVKSGAIVPIKLQLCDAAGANVSTPATFVTATGLTYIGGTATGELMDAGDANPDDNFRYSEELAGYIFNLKTTGLVAGTWEVVFRAGTEDATYAVRFAVR
jgi:hypothetical protein